MPIFIDKISAVLNRGGFEGPQQVKGYIPCNKRSGGTANYRGGPNPSDYVPMGISGVTIATGVDLGQTNDKTLRSIGVSDETVALLSPYLRKQKFDAVKALHNQPLTISRNVADELDLCMHAHHAKLISTRYDRDAGAGAFESLPWQAQAAIFSILYQRGVNSPSKFSNTWKSLVDRDWVDASARLKNGSMWKGYQSRRWLEGELLEELL